MSEAVELYVVLGIIYLVECAQWVPCRAVGLVALLPGRWRLFHPWRGSAHWRRGAVLGLPLPPLSPALICEPLPLVLGPEGIVACWQQGSGPAEGYREEHVAWDQVSAIETSGRDLLVNGRLLARLATSRLAQETAKTLHALARRPRGARIKGLRRLLDHRLSTETVQERRRALLRQTSWLRLSANILWLSVFGGLPALLWTSLVMWWAPILGTVLLSWITTAVLFRRSMRRLLGSGKEIWPGLGHRLLVYLSPLSAMRACDLLAREMLGDLDPLAAGAALLSGQGFAEQARLVLVDLTEPRGPLSDPGGEGQVASRSPLDEARAWLQEEMAGRIKRLLSSRGLSPDQLLAPPRPDDPRCLAWCPRCRAQYIQGETCTSSECNGMRLRRF